jgi:outer membrane receptor protein involved in Fe transport
MGIGVNRTLVKTSVFLVLACSAGMAQAQKKTHVDIPAQPLADSLRAIGSQSNTNILFDRSLVADRQAAALKAYLTPDEALSRLLAGTGIKHEFLNETTVVIARADGSDASSPGSGASAASAGPSSPASKNDESKEGQKSAGRFQLAQTDQRAASQSSSVTAGSQDAAGNVMGEVVVTAQKREERLKDVPISMSVLSGDQLDLSSSQGVSAELTKVPGIVAFPNLQAGGGTIISVRGVSAGSATFAGSNPVSYYLDSVPFGLVQSAVTPDSNAYDLERVEVLRGPQGTLYGASAQAGVVRVLTKDANLDRFELKMRASTSATDGGGDNYRGDAAINVPIIEGKLAARAVVGYQDQSGWVDTPLGNNANDGIMRTARLKINAQPTDQLSIGLSAWLSRADTGGVPASDDNQRRGNLFPETGYNDYDAYGIKVGYDARSFSVTSMTSYLGFRSANALDTYQQFGRHAIGILGFRGWTFSEEINFSSLQQGPWRWTAGAIYRDATDQNGARTPGTVNYTNSSSSYAIFGELTRLFMDDKLGLTLGARQFHDNVVSREDPINAPLNPPNYYREEGTFHSTTPRVVLTWHPNTTLSVYGSYSQGFRSGTPQAYYTTGGRTGFPLVEPDKLSNYEIGVKSETGRLSVEAAVYYEDWKDVQQQLTVFFAPTGQYIAAIANGPSASGPGVEMSITARPMTGLRLNASAGWNDLRLDADIFQGNVLLFAKGDRQNFSPAFTGGVSGDYSFPLGAGGYTGEIALSANYSSKQGRRSVFNGRLVLGEGDPILMTHASIALQSPNNWEVSLYGDNLNNENGAVVGSPFFGIDGSTRVRPRTFGLQLDYHW